MVIQSMKYREYIAQAEAGYIRAICDGKPASYWRGTLYIRMVNCYDTTVERPDKIKQYLKKLDSDYIGNVVYWCLAGRTLDGAILIALDVQRNGNIITIA